MLLLLVVLASNDIRIPNIQITANYEKSRIITQHFR